MASTIFTPTPDNPTTTKASAVTPEIRNAAITMLAEGVPPTALGTILPSPHPQYVRALYLGPMSNVSLFFDSETIFVAGSGLVTDFNIDHNDSIIYFDDWSIDSIMNQATIRSLGDSKANDVRHHNNNNRDHDLEEQAQTLQRVQNRAARALAQLQTKVQEWKIFDNICERRNNESVEVIVNDPLTKQPGALENLVGYWRARLGWVQTAVGYWYDPSATAIGGQNLRFVAYMPVNTPALAQQDAQQGPQPGTYEIESLTMGTKYFFSHFSGTWKTEEGIAKEQEKSKRDRNAWLVSEIGRIERDRDDDLVMEGASSILRHINGTGGGDEAAGAWSGGAGQDGQRATRRRKVKKQVPERRYSSIEFIPEDGGLPAFERLQETAITKPADRPVGEETIDTADGRGVHQTQILQIATEAKRKRSPSVEEDARPLAVTTTPTSIITAPPAKKRKAAPLKIKTGLPLPSATRRSSRLAGNNDDEDEPAGELSAVAETESGESPEDETDAMALVVTPHRPTSTTLIDSTQNITTSPLPPLTASSRESLMASYPFLQHISDEAPAPATTTPASDSNMLGATDDNDDDDSDTYGLNQSSRGEWLHFLRFFGKYTGTMDQINTFFAVDGALERQAEFLEALKKAVGQVKRVADQDGLRRYVWSD